MAEKFVSFPFEEKMYDIFYEVSRSETGFEIYVSISDPHIQVFTGPNIIITHRKSEDLVTFEVHGPKDYEIKSELLKLIAGKEKLNYYLTQ